MYQTYQKTIFSNKLPLPAKTEFFFHTNTQAHLPKNHPSATISLYPQRFFLSCHLGINNKACSFPYIFHVVHNKLYISILHWTEVVETITRWHINFTKYHNKTVYKERLKYPKTWVSHVHKSCESSQKNIFNEVLFK